METVMRQIQTEASPESLLARAAMERTTARALRRYNLECLLFSDEPWSEVLIKFHPLISRLLKTLDELGYQMRFVPSPVFLGDPPSYVVGRVYLDSRLVFVSRTDPGGKKLSVAGLAFVLAHELRHALHYVDHCFPDFYHREWLNATPEAFTVAKLRAELDCDAFAAAYLRCYGGKDVSAMVERGFPNFGDKYLALFRGGFRGVRAAPPQPV